MQIGNFWLLVGGAVLCFLGGMVFDHVLKVRSPKWRRITDSVRDR